MRRISCLISTAAVLSVAALAQNLPPMPAPVTDNAVVSVKVNGDDLVYSLSGLGPQKTWNSVTDASYALNLKYARWTTVRSAPGSGRLGAVAAAAQEQVFLIGGFVPDKSGLQAILPDVSVYDPIGLRWYRGPDLLTPVRDGVVGVYRDRYIYVVGGFSPTGLTNAVQIYDVQEQHWLKGTPFPGAAVFGHAGTVVDGTIIYIDGAKKNPEKGAPYIPSDECWMGRIDRHDPKKIAWSKLPPHPGTARYRIAAGGSDKDDRAYFVGGSSTIYDYNGIGLDGKPAEPAPVVFDYNFKKNAWETIQENAPNPTMDHRGLIVTSDGLLVLGGMGPGQKVLATVTVLPKGK